MSASTHPKGFLFARHFGNDLPHRNPLAKRHLVYQCSICGRKHVHWRADGCSCCADNLMHGITVDEKEWLRLLAND